MNERGKIAVNAIAVVWSAPVVEAGGSDLTWSAWVLELTQGLEMEVQR